MFAEPGSVGIFAVGVVGGFYFGRFFDDKRDLDVTGFVSLLTVIGLGPTALVLIRAYRELNLLDPYGIGLLAGVALNLVLATWLKATLPAQAQGRRASTARAILSLTGRKP